MLEWCSWQHSNKLFIDIHTLSFSLSSRWKFTFYLYIFTYGVRFLKKVRVWGFFCFFFNSNTCDAVLTLIVFKLLRIDRWGTQQKHANIVALNKCWPSCDGVTSMAWFVKSQNKNQHHIIYYMIIPFIMICITWLLPHPAVRSCYFLLELFCVLKWVLQLLLCGWSG